MSERLCPLTGKIMHAREKASTHLARLRGRPSGYPESSTYRCAGCGAYHVGSRRKTSKKRRASA